MFSLSMDIFSLSHFCKNKYFFRTNLHKEQIKISIHKKVGTKKRTSEEARFPYQSNDTILK